MWKTAAIVLVIVALSVLVLLCFRTRAPGPEDVIAAFGTSSAVPPLEITAPFDRALFPRDIAAPTFRWEDVEGARWWYVAVARTGTFYALSQALDVTEWTPSSTEWEAIKEASLDRDIGVLVVGVGLGDPLALQCAGDIRISTSPDPVEAPIFYREVNLPFIDAVKDPTTIQWRFGPVSATEQPPVVLDNLPVCGNCHSFSADGSVLGMDVDYANDKGSYAVTPVSAQIVLDDESIITWSDYEREDGQLTFGLLSQVSPSGRYVVSTAKDRSVFVPKPELSYSQLFFPVKGILVVYDRESQTYVALPGAADPAYVQSNPTWSPDEKQVVFARAEAYELKTVGDSILLTAEECEVFLKEGKDFRFDLYRVPFNGGKGGVPEPLAGASKNGKSNFFARYSPDGKWIVFCKASNYMLLQPDSELYIVPAAGGEARRLDCNMEGAMNSWHSWSPNGKWLVFSSKRYGPYTQLFLSHIDEQGNSSVPVLLDRFTAPDRAANIPEFVAGEPDSIHKIAEDFLDEVSFIRAGAEFAAHEELDEAERCFRRALSMNPDSAKAHDCIGCILMRKGKLEQAKSHLEKCIKLDPDMSVAYENMAELLSGQGAYQQAVPFLEKAIALDSDSYGARHDLGVVYDMTGDREAAIAQYREAIRLNPGYTEACFRLGAALHAQGKIAEAIEMYQTTIEADPTFSGSYYNLGLALRSQGRTNDAIRAFGKAFEVGGDATPALQRLAELRK